MKLTNLSRKCLLGLFRSKHFKNSQQPIFWPNALQYYFCKQIFDLFKLRCRSTSPVLAGASNCWFFSKNCFGLFPNPMIQFIYSALTRMTFLSTCKTRICVFFFSLKRSRYRESIVLAVRLLWVTSHQSHTVVTGHISHFLFVEGTVQYRAIMKFTYVCLLYSRNPT